MEELRLMIELRELTIDPEFRDLIPPLAENERQMLEESIVANGCESPLAVWNDTIVDGHNRYDICRKHGIPFAVLEKDFADRDTALLWMIQTQLGRRNLTAYQKSELALRSERLFREQASKRQATSTGGITPQLIENSPEADKTSNTTDKQLAKIAGVSDNTIRKVRKIAAKADDTTLQQLRSGKTTIHKAYTDLLRNEHKGEKKVCERCLHEKPVTEFSIPSKCRDFSALCKQCEAEVESAAKAAAEVASQTTEPVETQPVSSMAMLDGHPIHVGKPLPDEPDMFKHVLDMLQLSASGYIANVKSAMKLYTNGMASEENDHALRLLLTQIGKQSLEIYNNRMKEMENA